MTAGLLTRRQFLPLLVATAAGSSGILSACQQVPGAGPTSSSGSIAPRARADSPVVVMQAVEANSLDPQFRSAIPELNINAHVFNMCTWRDPRSLRIVPEFVQKWRLLDDRTWELEVPAGARFQDGSPADAEALAFSLTRQAKMTIGGKPTLWGSFWGRLSAFDIAEVATSTTVRLKTKAPAPIVPDLLSSVEVVPPAVYADESAENLARVATHPIGSGAYRLVEWQKDDHLVLEAFEGYWGPKPSLRSVIFKPVPEASTRMLALQNGEADVIVNVAPDQSELLAHSSAVRVSSVTSGRNIFVGMRADHPLLADKRVRQAFNLAVNFDSVNGALLNGVASRMKTIVNPPHEPADAKAYPYDPDRARALLAEVGWRPGADGFLSRDGERLQLEMSSPNGRYTKDKEIAQAVAQDLRGIGADISVKVLDWSAFAADVLAKRDPTPLYFLGLGSTFSGQEELNGIHRDFALNATHWDNPEYHRLFDELQVTLDEKRRGELTARLSAISFDDPPWIFIDHQVDFYGMSRRLEWEPAATERIRMLDAKFAE